MDSTHHQTRTLQKKRTTNFREDETKLLISLWGSPYIQNKLYLTHRKAPVMRLLAANMQQRGFYRSPDEIKTRIRNLKCLYHRIKRTMVSGQGIGTVDPDWPHFKAMDAILSSQGRSSSKEALLRSSANAPSAAAAALAMSAKEEPRLQGPRCEDIKQEADVDLNEDGDSSWQENESAAGSEYEDDLNVRIPTPPTPTPTPTAANAKPMVVLKKAPPPLAPAAPHHFTLNGIQAFQLGGATHNTGRAHPHAHQQQRTAVAAAAGGGGPNATTVPSIPMPLLILNGLQQHHHNPTQQARAQVQQQQQQQQHHHHLLLEKGKEAVAGRRLCCEAPAELRSALKDLLDVQRQHLEVEKQRLDLEKQRLEFDRVVSSQLLAMVPMVGGLLQRLIYPGVTASQQQQDSTPPQQPLLQQPDNNEAEPKEADKEDYDLLKDSKILRTVLENGIKKYMSEEAAAEQHNSNSSCRSSRSSSISGEMMVEEEEEEDEEEEDEEEEMAEVEAVEAEGAVDAEAEAETEAEAEKDTNGDHNSK